MMRRLLALSGPVAGALSLWLLAGGMGYTAEPGGPERLPNQQEVFQIKFQQALAAALDGPDSAKKTTDDERAALRDFYADRNGRPFWIENNKLTKSAESVIATIGAAGDYALNPRDYPLPAGSLGSDPTPDQLADTEIKLSIASLDYAHDAHVGRILPEQVSNMIDRGSTPPKPKAVLADLAKAPEAGAVLLGYHPKHPQFAKLLKVYNALKGGRAPEPVAEPASAAVAETTASADKTAVVIPRGPNLHPGDRHPQIAMLRERLGAFLSPDAGAEDQASYDDVLAVAVRKFQVRNDLPDDGIITRDVRKALNKTVKRKTTTIGKAPVAPKPEGSGAALDRITVNLQRWRWMREDMGDYHIINNVPEFLTRVVDNGKVVFTEKIVTGKTDTPTPTFSQDMQFIEFNPFWNVPASIKTGEILPKLRAGDDIMGAQNLRASYKGQPVDVYNIDWSTTDIRGFDFQQPPGKANVLGVVKFMFPNHYDVYMHDTPSKTLFDKSVRTFSHGCMRVHNPQEFARVLLEHDQGWDQSDVQRAVAEGSNQQVRLQKPIPVHVAYFTAWVQDDGSLSTFGDWYGHDRRLAMALNGKTELLAQEVAVAKRKAQTLAQAAPDPGFQDSAPNFLQLLFGGN
jgi:L,D-transpeptidase YcbB